MIFFLQIIIDARLNFPDKKCIFSGWCDNAVIGNSNGITKEEYPSLLGKYHYHQLLNGRPAFNASFDATMHLYFDSDDQWKVCYTNNRIHIVG